MQKRLFTAISLPEEIKKRLFRFVSKEYRDLPVKWVRQENFHITLNFLGYVQIEKIPEICESIRKVSESEDSFELEFTEVRIGPNPQKKKMIWATGEKSKELSELKYRLDKTLGLFIREKREFKPHITLGRIQREKWKKIYPEPLIERSLNFFIPVSSLEILESRFEKGKRVYYVLESFPLK